MKQLNCWSVTNIWRDAIIYLKLTHHLSNNFILYQTQYFYSTDRLIQLMLVASKDILTWFNALPTSKSCRLALEEDWYGCGTAAGTKPATGHTGESRGRWSLQSLHHRYDTSCFCYTTNLRAHLSSRHAVSQVIDTLFIRTRFDARILQP